MQSNNQQGKSKIPTSPVPGVLNIMMHMISYLSLQSVLSYSSLKSDNLKKLIPEVAKIGSETLQELAVGINKYNNSSITPHAYNGSIEECLLDCDAKIYSFSQHGVPVLFIPSLINKPYILDISEKNSLLLRLAKNGIKPYLLDWGNVQPNHTIEQYTTGILAEAVQYVSSKEKCPIFLAGYCMGGIMMLGASPIVADKIAGMISIATPWDFSKTDYPTIDSKTFQISFREQGYIPGIVIQMLFYLYNTFEVNKKFVDFAKGKFNDNTFIELENWVNDSCDLSLPVFIESMEAMIKSNLLYKGEWVVNNNIIDARKIDIPTLCIVAKKDKISPYQSAIPLAKQLKNSTLRDIDCGHVSMIISQKYGACNHIAQWVQDKDL